MSAGSAGIDVDRIDSLLPQTQCTRCGYAGCRPYAEAIAAGQADINQCPPGGADTITALAGLLQRPEKPLNPLNGVQGPALIAWIDEARCIGCAKCLPPCPVDAIIGASKFLHTVISERCTGCELCLAPCPVDCILMLPAPAGAAANDPPENRARYEAHLQRTRRLHEERAQELARQKAALQTDARAP